MQIRTKCPNCSAPLTSETTRKSYQGKVIETTVSCTEHCGFFDRVNEDVEHADWADSLAMDAARALGRGNDRGGTDRLAADLRGVK